MGGLRLYICRNYWYIYIVKKYIQTEYLKISHFSAPEWLHPVHNHNHYEIIFINKGSGIHHLSGTKHRYQPRSIFLLAPCDYHYFEIEEETDFVFIKFTNVYFSDKGDQYPQKNLFRKIETLFIQAGKQQWPVINNEDDLDRLQRIVDLSLKEWEKSKTSGNETLFFLLQALISIIRRNLQNYSLPAGQSNEKITDILNYIHQHIQSVDLVQVANLSKIFGYSPNYLGVFFKLHVGLSLRDYINKYRIQMIKNRLRSGSQSLKEISFEMGFTDLSHFNKFFKVHVQMNPSTYRQLVEKQI